MTLQQLHFLKAVVTEGSINQAAKRLFVAQSSISNAIRELEAELGITIFFRHNKGMRLTREGQELFEQVGALLLQEEQILTHFVSGQSQRSTPLKLTVSTLHFPFAAEALVEFLTTTAQDHYDIRLKENNIQYIIDDVDSGQSDMGLLFLSSSSEDFIKRVLLERGLTFHLLATTVPHAFLRKDHPLAGRTDLHIADFDPYPYVIFDLEYSSANYSEEVIHRDTPRPTKILHLTDRGTVYNVLRHTDAYQVGSGVLPVGYSDPHLTSVPIARPSDQILQIGYIHPARKKPSSTVSRFVELLSERLAFHTQRVEE